MVTYKDYPARVTRYEDGEYRWECAVDQEQELGEIMLAMKICAGILIALAIYGFFLSGKGFLPYLLAAVAVVFGICGLFWLLVLKGKGRFVQRYEMTDEYIRFVGTEKTMMKYEFKDLIYVRLLRARKAIELKSKKGTAVAFTDPEELLMVRDHIIENSPATVMVRYD